MVQMRSIRNLVAGLLAVGALALAVAAVPAGAAASAAGGDVFTPVTAEPLAPNAQPVRGTDGRWHVVYELRLTNSKLAPATIRSVAVLDARHRSRVIARWSGRRLLDRLRTLLPEPAKNAVIPPNGGRFLFVELSFARLARVPRTVVHRITLRASGNPGATKPTLMHYTVAPFDIRAGRAPVLGPPLRGNRWVVTNGCCNSLITHRGSIQTINGDFFDAQRYAIDWQRLDSAGRFVSGNPSDVHSYADYGAPVLAVANGTVVSTLKNLRDQVPGQLPNPGSFKTVAEVDGNHVELALGHGLFANYAHLQRGSIRVHVGQRVRRGQVIARLGNSGNTSAPHLHFHLQDGPSALGSEGLPYTIRRFQLAGQINAKRFDAATGVEGFYGDGLLARPIARRGQFPMNLNIVDFP